MPLSDGAHTILGAVSVYSSNSDTFAAAQWLMDYLSFAAFDGPGTRALFDDGKVVDGSVHVVGVVPGAGKGVAVNRAGTTGYRLQDRAVQVIDMATQTVVKTLPLPEPVSSARGSIALSAAPVAGPPR